MWIKRFKAATVPDAMALVKQELGPEAVILETRVGGRHGWFPFGRRDTVEVVAASPWNRTQIERCPPRSKSIGQRAKSEGLCPVPLALGPLRGDARRQPGVSPLPSRVSRLPEMVRPLYEGLLAQGVDGVLATGILSALLDEVKGELPQAPSLLKGYLARILAREIKVGGPIRWNGGRMTVALVGPTGVGKTTAVIKLAARYALGQGRRISILTLDGEAGSLSRLSAPARIMDLPLRWVPTPQALHQALERDEADLILIDTMGRNPRRAEDLTTLTRFLKAAKPLEVHLVVSATTKRADLFEILKGFKPTGFTRLLVTKLDEASCLGPLVSLCQASSASLSYLAWGPRFIEDLEEADPLALATLIVQRASSKQTFGTKG